MFFKDCANGWKNGSGDSTTEAKIFKKETVKLEIMPKRGKDIWNATLGARTVGT